MLAHDPRAELNRLIMAEQQAGLAPTAASTGSWSWPASPTPLPTAEQALRERLAKRSHRPSAALAAHLDTAWGLLLALMAGIYAGTGRYQAWLAYQSRPDPLAGLSPRDLQDKELGALHQRLQANPADLDGWAALGQLVSLSGRVRQRPCSPTSVSPCIEGRQRCDPGRTGYRALTIRRASS